MKKYILKRLLLSVPTFLGVTVAVYFLMSLAPGSPLDAFLSVPGITDAELNRIKESLGLDKPVFMQYYHWLVNILKGNFGYSFSGSKPVINLIADRLPATLMLAASSLILSFIIAIYMRNKENINGKLHDRPCFYTFKDGLTGLYRMIPFSSQTSKFRKIFNNKNIAIQLFLVKFLAMKKLFLFKICVR